MCMSTDELQQFAEDATPVFEKYGLRYAGLFGSYARGEATPESDVDILVQKGEKPLSLFDYVHMQDELSSIFKKDVDVVSETALIPYFKEYILRDVLPLYGER